MELDTKRKLIIGALDPRHTEIDHVGPARRTAASQFAGCKSGFYVISYADPANLRQVGDFVELPSGHTSSCIQDCRYIWTGGPARRGGNPAVWNPELIWLGPILGPDEPGPFTFPRDVGNGRPIWVTDLREPVPARGVRPARRRLAQRQLHGLLARRRRGRPGHRLGQRPRRHPRLRDEGLAPRPVPEPLAQGDAVRPDPRGRRRRRRARRSPAMFMHNSGRPTDGSVRADGVKKGNVLVGTEEEFQDCEESGRIVLSDLTDSWGGEPAQQSTLTRRTG